MNRLINIGYEHLTGCDCDLCRMQCVPIALTADPTCTTYVLGRIIIFPAEPPRPLAPLAPPAAK